MNFCAAERSNNNNLSNCREFSLFIMRTVLTVVEPMSSNIPMVHVGTDQMEAFLASRAKLACNPMVSEKDLKYWVQNSSMNSKKSTGLCRILAKYQGTVSFFYLFYFR
jgi:hypothetical protein